MTVTLAQQPQRARTPTAGRACDLETTCQPPSAWVKDPWTAVIRNIWTAGMCLFLERRFEKGSGLAIQLPREDGTYSTVLARVVQLQPEAPGYLLEVSLISELSEEEVDEAVRLSAARHASLEEPSAAPPVAGAVKGVLFLARLPNGKTLRWYVKRLDVPGGWPLRGGKVLSLRVAGLKSPLRLRARRCRAVGKYWAIVCDLAAMPTPEELAVLNGPNVLP